MPYSEYWNPKNETLPREDLQALQLLKLQRLCTWAYATTPFHQRQFDAAGFKPEDIVYFAFGYGSFIGFWSALCLLKARCAGHPWWSTNDRGPH